MKTHLITSEEELVSVKDQWNRLVQGNSLTDYVFYTWEWFHHSWQYAGRPDLFVAIASRENEIAGILPLVVVKSKSRGISICSLIFCPNGNTPRNNILVAAGEDEEQTIRLLFRQIRDKKRHWDTLELVNIEQSTVLHAMLTEPGEHDFAFSQIIRHPGRESPFADFSGCANFDEYLRKHVRPQRRTNLRRDLKRLDETGKPWSVEYFADRESYEEGCKLLIEVRERSWKSTPSEAFRRFFSDICRDPFFDGRILIAILLLEEKPIAAEFFLYKNDVAQLCLADHDQEYHRSLTPGSNLLAVTMPYAIGHHWKELDFSGEAHEYKKRMATGTKFHSSFQVFHSGVKSRLIYLGKKLLPRWKAIFSREKKS